MVHVTFKTFYKTITQDIGDNGNFLKHIGVEQEGTDNIAVPYPCARIFMESESKMQSVVQTLPGYDGFGTWVPDPCANKTRSTDEVESTIARLAEKYNRHK